MEEPLPFDALELSFELIECLRKPVQVIQARDKDLARQIRRDACSIALKLAAGRERIGGDRLQLFRTTHGSAKELRAPLRVARSWGSVAEGGLGASEARLDRICAICWKLTHG